MTTRDAIAVGLLCLVLTSLSLPLVIRLLKRRGVLDVPLVRSSHADSVPRGAGLALAVGMLVSLLSLNQLVGAELFVLVGFTLLGACDDVRSLPARRRLAVQMLLACGIGITLEPSWMPPMFVVFVLLVVTATTNAVNFMDGINGITGLHAVIWGLVFAWLLQDVGRTEPAAFALALAGAGAAFLPWNSHRARAFLGDSGSYMIGSSAGLLAVISIPAVGPVAALCPVAIYAADTGSTLLRRVRAGEPVTQAHRDHTYQRLVRSGWTHSRTALVVAAFTLGSCVLGVASVHRSPLVQATLLACTAGLCGLFLKLPSMAGRTSRRLVGAPLV